jgi:hypothetical protein
VIVRLANIGAREIRKRQTLGIVSAMAAGLLGFLLIGYEAPWWTRLLLFLPLWLAGLGVFQAHERTCIALAARGACNMDRGEEQIDSAAQRDALRRQAERVHRRAILTAVLVTAVALLWP